MRKCCRVNKLSIDLASAYTPLRFRAAFARFKAMYIIIYSVTRDVVKKRENVGWKMS